MAAQRTFLAIDLKSFYASVECVDRHLDPLTTNLVVADASRTEKTICLAVSPSLKAYKIPGRARLFEAVQRVRDVNAQRLQTAIRQNKAVRGEDGKYHFASTSFDASALNTDPALGLSYIVAPPRMQRYLDVSTQIYKSYLKYVSPADIYPYSIDEVFIDVTGYLPYYHMSAHDLAMTMVREVLYNTGITATAGIDTNLYLAKLAMDIVVLLLFDCLFQPVKTLIADDVFNTAGIGLRSFGVNACGDKLLGKEAVTLVDFFGYLAAHIGQMEKVIFVHHKKAAVPQGSRCMAHAGL